MTAACNPAATQGSVNILGALVWRSNAFNLEKSPHQIIGENSVKREAARDCIERSVTKPCRAKVGQNSGIGIVTVSATFF